VRYPIPEFLEHHVTPHAKNENEKRMISQ